MEYKNKEKLKEQNSSRITEPKNGLTVTKGKGTGEDGWEGGIRGIKGIMISTHNVGLGGDTGKAVYTEKTSNDSIASYYANGQ